MASSAEGVLPVVGSSSLAAYTVPPSRPRTVAWERCHLEQVWWVSWSPSLGHLYKEHPDPFGDPPAEGSDKSTPSHSAASQNPPQGTQLMGSLGE